MSTNEPEFESIDSTADCGNRSPRPIVPKNSRRRTILWMGFSGLLIALVVAVALIALPLLKSPAQIAADAAPPPAEPVTAVVEKRSLTSQVVMRGVLAPGPSFAFKPSDALIEKAPVVTATPLSIGSRFGVGAVVLETNGEPLIAMNWPFPAYRDIEAGNIGPDVAQLQLSLAALGYSTSQSSVFDVVTQRGLTKFYTDLGYEVPRKAPASRSGLSDAGPAAGSGAPVVDVVYLPARNVAAVPKSENVLTSLSVGIGTKIMAADAPLMTLDGGSNIVTASTSPERAATLKVGDKAQLTSVDGSTMIQMEVQSIGTEPGEIAGLGTGVRIDLRFVDSSSVPPVGAAGSTQKVTVTTGGELAPVLVIPITAVYSNANGTSYVIPAARPDDTIAVSVGTNVDGWVKVIPTDPSQLGEGDRIVVGRTFE
ncbi:hypothetical protein [Paenarthrobacter sp. NPDC089316]|uniref:hypothetical protein n=1 Tax=unclassified Paenarthrobacter TaxID=2634190 RepID=UPI0034309735